MVVRELEDDAGALAQFAEQFDLRALFERNNAVLFDSSDDAVALRLHRVVDAVRLLARVRA